ncbi:MAG: energy transducer TonB [Gemmatimonadota bacterium]|nr:energy transducer TonB [Gemmatimonadota bacterium]
MIAVTLALSMGSSARILAQEAGSRPPQAVPGTCQKPVYPPLLRDAGIEGAVYLNFAIGADGVPYQLEVAHATHQAFVPPARAALLTCRFQIPPGSPSSGVAAFQKFTFTISPGGAPGRNGVVPSAASRSGGANSAPPAAAEPSMPTRLSPLRPSVSDEVEAAGMRIFDAAARTRACDAGPMTITREVFPGHIRLFREQERVAEASGNTWDYKVLQSIASDMAEDFERPRPWSNCTRLYADLARLWRAQERRLSDHRAGLKAQATQPGADYSSGPPAAPSARAPAAREDPSASRATARATRDPLESAEERYRMLECDRPSPAQVANCRAVRETINDLREERRGTPPAGDGTAQRDPAPRSARTPIDRYPAAPDPPSPPPGDEVGLTPAVPDRAGGCAKIEREGNGTFVRNRCTCVKILFEWYDEGSCRTGCVGWGMDGLPPGSRETITPVKGRWAIAACEFPNSVVVTSRSADGWPLTYKCS